MIEGNQVLTKVFACGVGFPVRTKDGSGVELNPFKNPRADSFSLYMNVVGDLLLKNLLPKQKILANINHIEEIKESWLTSATYEQVQNKNGEREKRVERIYLDLEAEKANDGRSKYNHATRSKSEYRPGVAIQKTFKLGNTNQK